jgi:class 3 adenylate cyclase
MQEKVYNMPNGSKVRTHTNGSSPYGGKPNTVSALTMKLEGDKERAGDNGLSLRRETSKSSRNSKNSKSSKSSKASKASKASLTLPPKEVLSPGGNLNSSRHKNVHAMAGIYGYNERDDDESDPEEEAETLLYEKDTEAEPSFMTALRGGGLSKSESEQKLAQQLSQVAQVKDYSGKDDRLQTLKEKFGGSKRSLKPRAERRLSSSSASSSQYSAQSFSQSSFALSQNGSFADLSVDLLESSKRSEMSFNFTASSHTSTSLNAFNMSNYSQKGDSSFNMSANTLPATNVVKSAPADNKKNAVKTDQIIESLVWFSFHTPRAVLEDLISHEMDLWRAQRIKSSRRVLTVQEKMAGKRLDDDDDSCSSISDEGGAHEIFGKNFSETMMQMKVKKTELNMLDLPKCVERESALLFVDMSGFTKLSTMLDVESFAKVINSYFDMIVSEVILYGGDILKFAGDAFFAEWKVVEDDETEEGYRDNPLAHLNASLASINEFNWDDDDDIPKLSSCVLSAAKCGAAIVRKFSDYQVTCLGAEKTMLNVHCGIGVGDLVGLHIGDFKEDQEEEGVELRREFLILGEPIDQVSFASPCFRYQQALCPCQYLGSHPRATSCFP